MFRFFYVLTLTFPVLIFGVLIEKEVEFFKIWIEPLALMSNKQIIKTEDVHEEEKEVRRR